MPNVSPRLTSPWGFCSLMVPCAGAAGALGYWASGYAGSFAPALLTAALACGAQGIAWARASKPLRALGAEGDPALWAAGEIERLRAENESLSARNAERSNRARGGCAELARLFDEMSASHEHSMESIGESASAVGDLQREIRTIADNSEEAARVANQTKALASAEVQNVLGSLGKLRHTYEVVEQSGGSIQKLQEASEKIGEMVGIIEDIADQTNLLALNAAIEAARAGEQGRGFAVVADEVRKLAEKTVTATRRISEVVVAIQGTARSAMQVMNKGVEGVGSGVEIITNTGEALADIENLMDTLTSKIEGIAAATEQQAAGATQINGSVATLTKTARRAAIHVETASESAYNLSRTLEA